MEKLKSKMLSGFTWSFASQGVTQVLTFVIMVILARLLSPREFGLVAMVTALSGFASLFAELGLGAALIQKKDVSELQLSSVFWVNLVCGTLLSLLFVAAAPLIASFYGEPVLNEITVIVSLNFVINAFIIVQRILLKKNMEFRTLSIADMTARLLSGLIVILMALMGYSYWSLVWQTLIMSTIINVVLWKHSRWRPSFSFSYSSIRELLGFGANVLGTSTLDYWTRSLDKVLLGKFFGSDALGLYSRAHMLLVFRINSISRIVSNVFFPAMSRIQDDKDRVKRAYLKTLSVVALITFPLTLGLFSTADNFVLVLFGVKWIEMVPVLKALCLLGLTTSMGSLTGAIFLSQGAAKTQFRLGLVLKGFGIVGIVVGLKWGAVGVALCYGLVTLINTYPSITIAGRLIGLNYFEFLKALFGPFVCSLLMGALVMLLPVVLPESLSVALLLTAQVCTGGLFYWLTLHLAKVDSYLELLELAKNKFNSRPANA